MALLRRSRQGLESPGSSPSSHAPRRHHKLRGAGSARTLRPRRLGTAQASSMSVALQLHMEALASSHPSPLGPPRGGGVCSPRHPVAQRRGGGCAQVSSAARPTPGRGLLRAGSFLLRGGQGPLSGRHAAVRHWLLPSWHARRRPRWLAEMYALVRGRPHLMPAFSPRGGQAGKSLVLKDGSWSVSSRRRRGLVWRSS